MQDTQTDTPKITKFAQKDLKKISKRIVSELTQEACISPVQSLICVSV